MAESLSAQLPETGKASVPMADIGPVALKGDVQGEVMVPMATYETTLWPSTNRGAAVTRRAGGIQVRRE